MAARPRAVVIVAILAIAIAVVASMSLYNYLKSREAEVEKAKKAALATQKVVVASKSIPIGSAITGPQIKVIGWPAETVPANTFNSEDLVVGRVALVTFSPGDPITSARLRPEEGPPGIMTYKISEGHRAMTVGVDQVSGVAGFITPGNMVDIVFTTTNPRTEQKISKIILQNVPVLATGQIIEQEEGKPIIVPTVTLDLTPEDSEKLATAASEGQLRLLLRGSGDTDLALTSGATVTKVLTGAPGPSRVAKRRVVGKRAVKAKAKVEKKVEPPKPVYDTVAVEVLRDGNRKVETFKVKKEDN